MNWRHFQTFVWLRWRLLRNEVRRAGRFNAVLMMIIVIAALVTAIPLLVGSFVLGIYAIPKAAPAYLMYAWDAVILVFLFFWGIGLLTELQRSEPLALSKFMHLPVSVNAAFLINYFSSLLRLSLVIFGPIMLGYALALIYVKGASLAIVLPLLAAFLLMITALTYQFQGWLAALMSNPRRRRAIIVGTTGGFILLSQLPNLVNVYGVWGMDRGVASASTLQRDFAKLERAFRAKEFNGQEYVRRQEAAMKAYKVAVETANRESLAYVEKIARLANMVFPAGWLPIGVLTAAEGRLAPPLLALLGMTLIGSASLWRAYRGMVGVYQGQLTNRQERPVSAAAAITSPVPRKSGSWSFLETRLPGFSEPVSAIALAGFRSLSRSPEAKMALLTPLIMGLIFGSMMLKARQGFPVALRPLTAITGITFILLSVLQLAGNQFGTDRDGFRIFVLCAAPRRDILLGKNLSYVPPVFAMSAILFAAVQIFSPMRLDHFLAMFPQLLSMFLVFCLFTNLMSIYAPVYMTPGPLRASGPKATTVLLQLAMVFLLFPLLQGLTLLPLGAEMLFKFLGWTQNAPVFLLLSLTECAALVVVYHFVLNWQGRMFQAREQHILDTVTNRAR